MLDYDSLKLGDQGNLEFFGRITASISHELNNVISIIDQVAGLLEDNLAAIDEGYPIQPEQLERIYTKISNQTKRGVEIIRRLNKFAHSTDYPVCEFDLKEVIQNLSEICERFAELRKIPISVDVQGESCKTINSPFLTQQVIFYLLNHSFEISNSKEPISLRIVSAEETCGVEIKVPVCQNSTDDWIKRANQVAEVLNGKILTANNQDGSTLIEFQISSIDV